MMLGHVESVDDGLQMRSCSLYGQDAFLLELPTGQTCMFNVPRCIFNNTSSKS
jgi:hypothetical protein